MSYRPRRRRRRPEGARRLHDLLHAAGRLDGLAPVRRDPRAARPVLLGLRHRPRLRRRARAAARRGPRVEQVRRGLHAHARDRGRAGRRRARPPEEVERARAYAAGRRVLAFENTNAVARYAANQRIVFDEDIDPDAAIALLDAVTFDEVAEAARTVDPEQARRRLRRTARERRVLIRLSPSGRGASRVRSECVCVPVAEALNERELSRYVSRVSDRWPLSRAMLGGARVDDARGAAPQRERGPEYVVVLVSEMLRRRAVARARLPVRGAVGRGRDGRSRRRALLHAARVRAQAREPAARAPRRATTGSTCSPRDVAALRWSHGHGAAAVHPAAAHPERPPSRRARGRRPRSGLRGDRRALPPPAAALSAPAAERGAGRGRAAGELRARVAGAARRHRRARAAPVAVPHRPQPGAQHAARGRLGPAGGGRGAARRPASRPRSSGARSCARRCTASRRCPIASAPRWSRSPWPIARTPTSPASWA